MCYIRGEIEVSAAGKMPDNVPSRKAAVSVSALGIFLFRCASHGRRLNASGNNSSCAR